MAVAAIASSSFAKLFGSALQRGVSILLHKVTRLRKIDLSLRGETLQDTAVQKAINDFETVLGTYRGELDVRIDGFLTHLERSGITEALVESALLGQQSNRIWELFEAEYDRILGDHPKKARELYDQMYTSFRITLESLVKDPVLGSLMRRHHSAILQRLSDIEASISDTRAPKIDPIVELDCALKIAKGLQASYKEIRIETIRAGSRLVNIDKIYIAPHLSSRPVEKPESEVVLADLLSYGVKLPLLNTPSFFTREDVKTSLERTSYSDFRNSFRRAVILGDPGGGKSTLCQKMCYDLTRNFQLAIQSGAASVGVPAQSQKLAIRVILRKFEQARTSDSQLDLLSYICRDVCHYASVEDNAVRYTLLRILETGQAVLAFDGLDEILDTSKRREFVDLVKAFCDRYPLCSVLITSRLVGYDDARLPREYEEYVLSKLDKSDVQSYLIKFLREFAEKTANEAKEEAERFIEQTDANASDLRRNPLMLGLMAYLFHIKGDVPSNRPEIYRDCSTLMFERWDVNRGINPNIPSDFERSELFSEVARRMFSDSELRAGVDRVWLKTCTLDFFISLYIDKPRAISASKSITDFLVGRAWVMSEIGDDRFAFTHQTFLEYFFARYLDGQYDSVNLLLLQLRTKITRSEWDVVSHLSLQLKTHGSLRRQDEALDWLKHNIAKTRGKSANAAIRVFAANSLEYLNGSESKVSDLLRILTAPQSGKFDSACLSLVGAAEKAARHRKDFIRGFLTEVVVKEVLSVDADKQMLSQIVFLGDRYVEDANLIISKGLASEIKEKSKKSIVANSVSSPVSAVLSLQWYGHYEAGSIEKFGLKAFDAMFLNLQFKDGLSWIALSYTGYYRDSSSSDNLNVNVIAAVLREIGSSSFSSLFQDWGTYHLTRNNIGIPVSIWKNIISKAGTDYQVKQGLLLIARLSFKDYERSNGKENGRKQLQRIQSPIYNQGSPEFRKTFDELAKLIDLGSER